MSNVVSLFDGDLKHCSYYEVDGDVGVAMKDKSIIILPLNSEQFEVVLGDESHVFGRKEIAEFLHVASILVDSEQRWLPDVELAGLNYKD